MSKAVLVIEMPEKCAECPCQKLYAEQGYHVCEAGKYCGKSWGRVDLNSKPEWCPLVPLPGEQGAKPTDNVFEKGAKQGWNACLDAILESGKTNI